MNSAVDSDVILSIQIPTKTFVLGEYLALKGKGALVFAGKPRFQLLVKKAISTGMPFHPQSPAGRFWLEHEDFFRQFDLKFSIEKNDLNFTGVGCGSSTAEFIGLHQLFQLRDSLWIEQERFFDLHQMLKDYWRLTQNPKARFEASGADLVGQVRGGLTYFNRNNGKIQTFSWPFSNLSFSIFAMPDKLATHEHLAGLSDFDEQELLAATELGWQALKSVEESQFILSIQKAALALKKLGLVAPSTEKVLQKLREVPEVLAAKGCGALGADVVMVYYKGLRDEDMLINQLAEREGLRWLGNEKNLATGLNVQTHKEIS